MPIFHVAIVGHCGFDARSLQRFVSTVAPHVETSLIDNQMALDKIAKPGTLLLVNRELDGTFRVGDSGIDLIRDTATLEEPPVMMLISNYEDAQQQAMDAGAIRGFGKSHTNDTNTRDRVAETISAM